jgi:endonuclease III
LTETEIDKERRLSDGRVALGRFLGVGEQTSRLTAALIALGSRVCTSAQPKCPVCPVNNLCPSVGGVRSGRGSLAR